MVIEMEEIREYPWLFKYGYGIYLCRVCDQFTDKPREHLHGINVEAALKLREAPACGVP